MKRSTKRILAFIFNLLVVVLGIVGLILSFIEHGVGNIAFYTRDSNYLAMVSCAIYCVFAIISFAKKTEMPHWVYTFRFISTACLMVTFIVVVAVLMPLMPEQPFTLLYSGSMLYQHTLCPILAIISLLAFETEQDLPKKYVLLSLIPTFVYAATLLTLNLLRVFQGPYFFLEVYNQPWYMTLFWGVVILGIAAIISLLLRLFCHLVYKTTAE